MVYQYRLARYDEDWKNTNARRVEYEDLPQGNYTFEVLAGVTIEGSQAAR
jgi:hypothetical protein